MAYIVIGQPSYIVRSCLKRKEAGGKEKRRKEGEREETPSQIGTAGINYQS